MPRVIADDWTAVCAVLDKAELMHLSVADEQGAYCVPVNFVRVDQALYLHSGLKGRKMRALTTGSRICFAVEHGVELKQADMACKLGYRFHSVVGFGVPVVIADPKERQEAMAAIIAKWAGLSEATGPLPMDSKAFAKTAMVRIDVDSATLRIKE